LPERGSDATVAAVPFEGLPDVARRKALACGAEAWLAELPALVAGLEREWSIAVGRTLPNGTEAYVAEATALADGTPAVLKLVVPRADATGDRFEARFARSEITALRLAQGVGCARLLRDDVERGALLLERLGATMSDLDLPLARRQEILCATAARVWRPAPGAELPTGAEKARWLADMISRTWEELGRPCSERAVAHALACAKRRVDAHDDERAVLVHGDVHQWNALRAADDPDGWKLVDPDGLLAEAEYDLGILMREDPEELLAGDARARSRRLAALTGKDESAIWEWGVVERVSTGLLCTSIDLQPVGREMLAVADRLGA
jgi:streptomycin 6-kinase